VNNIRLLLLSAFALPLTLPAQAAGTEKGGTEGGVLVTGWRGRVDPQAEKKGATISDVKFWTMGGGLHVTAGPPATYWNPDHVATGNYRVSATFTQTTAPVHPEAYGLFIGGTQLDGDRQNYLYCVIFGTGMFSIKHRFGGEVHTLIDRRASGALKTVDGAGRATNEVAWTVAGNQVSCAINGTPVASFERAQLLGEGKLETIDGVYGIRVNHNLDVHIARFALTRP